MDWKRVLAVWDEMCPERKGVRGNVARYGDQAALKGIVASGVSEEELRERIAYYLGEEWRDCYQLSSLWSGWDAPLVTMAEKRRLRILHSQAVGNPPTKQEEIKRIWAEPPLRAGDEAHQELVAWLRKELHR